MKESHEMTWRLAEGHTRDVGGSSSQPSGSWIKRGLRQSFTTKEAEIPVRVLILICSSKQKSIKSMFSTENVKKV